jgi:GAF domain-containing protein
MGRVWTAKRLDWLLLYVLGVIAGVTGVFFLAAGIFMDGGFGRAWEILIGDQGPSGQLPGLAVPLSALGYIAVPTIIGLAVADRLTRFTQRNLYTAEETAEKAADLVETRKAARAEREQSKSAPAKDQRDPATGRG